MRGGHETESLTLADRDVVDGKVRAILIDGTPVVPILAADQQTTGFFRADADLALDHSGVVQEVNIDEIRWVRPDQIEMIDGLFEDVLELTNERPNWKTNCPSRSPRRWVIPTRSSGTATRAAGCRRRADAAGARRRRSVVGA